MVFVLLLKASCNNSCFSWEILLTVTPVPLRLSEDSRSCASRQFTSFLGTKNDSGRLGEPTREGWDVHRAAKFGSQVKKILGRNKGSAGKLIGRGSGWMRAWLRNRLKNQCARTISIRIFNNQPERLKAAQHQ